ncbi:MAG: S24 family peptidase, partial [Tannerella sp.]|nr:S24 family peptidase [Tannerella sp.]MDR2920096.1 S24 family peptidase [Tannerella sp.]
IQQIPLYEIEASAGLSMLFTNQSSQVPVGFITIPNAPKCDGAIPIRGDSMYPLLKSGDIACYKHLNSLENIQWGEIYILYIDADGDEMFVTKYVQRSELGDDYISLVSYNKHHQLQNALKKHIKAIAMMKISIRYNTNV